MADVRNALVTGGSSGIGKGICLALAAKGINVAVNYYPGCEKDAQAVAKSCQEAGVKAVIVSADVTKADQVEAMVNEVTEALGSIDILVNNAGITRDNLLMRMSEEDFQQVIDTNLKGAFLCMKQVSRPMMKQRYGKIINISSIVGICGNAGQVNYAASKAGIIGMTKSLAKELASRNVNVNAVAPGFIDTAMTEVLSEAVKGELLKGIPMARLGSVQDVAAAVCFLASDDAAYITGQVIQVDGGMVM